MAWWRITDADIKDSRIFGFWNIFAPGLRVIMGKHTLWTRGMSWKSVCAMPFHVHAPKWLQFYLNFGNACTTSAIDYMPTKSQPADILANSLHPPAHYMWVALLNMH